MGVEWVDGRCPLGEHHVFTTAVVVAFGHVWICKNCRQAKWLPSDATECIRLHIMMRKYGDNAGYQKFIDSRKGVAVAVKRVRDRYALKYMGVPIMITNNLEAVR